MAHLPQYTISGNYFGKVKINGKTIRQKLDGMPPSSKARPSQKRVHLPMLRSNRCPFMLAAGFTTGAGLRPATV